MAVPKNTDSQNSSLLTVSGTVVIICNTYFNIKETLRFAHKLYVWAAYDSQNKQ
jgi:hypothetical protein